MTKVSKLYERMRRSGGAIRFRDFQRLAEAFGFILDRVSGSHHIYKHPRVSRVLNIQRRGDEAKGYQLEEFLSMISEFELTMDE